jgi:hypothetical protein
VNEADAARRCELGRMNVVEVTHVRAPTEWTSERRVA